MRTGMRRAKFRAEHFLCPRRSEGNGREEPSLQKVYMVREPRTDAWRVGGFVATVENEGFRHFSISCGAGYTTPPKTTTPYQISPARGHVTENEGFRRFSISCLVQCAAPPPSVGGGPQATGGGVLGVRVFNSWQIVSGMGYFGGSFDADAG